MATDGKSEVYLQEDRKLDDIKNDGTAEQEEEEEEKEGEGNGEDFCEKCGVFGCLSYPCGCECDDKCSCYDDECFCCQDNCIACGLY